MVKATPGFTPDVTPGPTPSRRRSEDELDSNRAHKKPRTRVSYSCGECHRRKQKCDRQIPCSHCIARKVPELCKSYTPGKTDQDIHVRLARLEQIIETALPHYWNHGDATPNSDADVSVHDRRRSMSPMDDGNRSQAEDEDPSGGIFESGRWYGKSASSLVAAPAVLEQLQNMVPNPVVENDTSNGSLPVNQADIFKSDHQASLAPIEQTAIERLHRLIRDCGYSAERLQNMYNELPPRKQRDDLVDHYFTTINWTRYPISEHEFRASYATFLANEHNHANPNNIRFLPLLFVVLAISVRLAPERIGGSEQSKKMAGSRYYWCSRRALLIIAAIQPDCFEVVLIRMLSARFLVLDRRMTESWSQLGAAVRTAQAIGLHRDGDDMGMEPLLIERRRRIWSNLYHADRSIALVLGRPMAIHDNYTSTRPPMNTDEMMADGHFKTLPLTQPTRTTFLIFRHQLAGIMGRMSDFFQNVHSPRHYADVIALDDELLKYKQNLPPFFALDPDTMHDHSHPYIPLQRFLLVTEFLFVRISLHRPYLLRKLDSNKYARSRNACFESALKDYEIRQEYFTSISRTGRDPVASAYREFQAAMIAGIYLVLYPKGKDADDMHAVLDTFLERHERLPEMDDITRREMNIIEFLKSRSSQSAGTPESATTERRPSAYQTSPPGPSHLRAVAPRPPQHHTLSAFIAPSFASVASVPLSTATHNSYASHSGPSPAQVQQLQQSENASHSGTGSPGGDEDSTAQSLLDQWCNIFSGGPAVDDAPSGTGLPWATPGLGDLPGWTGANPTISSPLVGSDALPNVDGSDWSYWETLVNQIRSGPVS
ncbi:fungal-specific transcription factor domain-containing protein [Trametes gibbosa]|nr:fungal-specific transcription factor domain-containing protein [Trametes gibbosa]UVI59153.1 Zn(2)-Cys(6)55 [Trametes gibbosa]